MSSPPRDQAVPEADLQEQREPVGGPPESRPGSGGARGAPSPGGRSDRPEADVLEQDADADGGEVVVRGQRDQDVPEADWLEQSITEPTDEEDEARR